MFRDYGPGILYALARDVNSFNLSGRNVDVEQSSFGKPFAQYLPDREHSKVCCFSKLKVLSGNKAYSDSRHAKNCRLQRARNCTGIGGIIAEIATMIDSRSTNVWEFALLENLVQCQRHAIGRCPINRPVSFVNLPDSQRPSQSQAMRRSTHFCRGRDDVNISNGAQRFFERHQSSRMNPIVVC